MKFFRDKGLTEEIDTLHFGEVEAGQSAESLVYLFNDGKAVIRELNFEVVGTEDVTIENSPSEEIPSKGIVGVVFKWTPNMNLKEALKAEILITGKEVYMVE